MNKYLSFGAGVNSVAMLLLLIDEEEDFETVFVNQGGEHPETYQYLDYLKKQNFTITEIKPFYQNCNSLLEYCNKHKMVPIRMNRWCSYRFKVEPFLKYISKPCVNFVGIAFDERHRAKQLKDTRIKNVFPLIERKITRKKCIEIIKNHNLDIPPKSGCWFCPFQNQKQVRELFLNHFDLYQKLKEMEKWNGSYVWFNKSISKMAMENIPPLCLGFK